MLDKVLEGHGQEKLHNGPISNICYLKKKLKLRFKVFKLETELKKELWLIIFLVKLGFKH